MTKEFVIFTILIASSAAADIKKSAIQTGSHTNATNLDVAFQKLWKSDGHVAENLDVEIGKIITKSPEEFLYALKKHRSKIMRLDALVGNLGAEFVDDFEKQSVELRNRINALESVSQQNLKPIAVECIVELQSKLRVIEAPIISSPEHKNSVK